MMWAKKTEELLPKTLASRATKLPAENIEAEVLRIVGAKRKPAPAPVPGFAGLGQILQAGSIIPVPTRQEMERQRREMERQLLSSQQPMWQYSLDQLLLR